MYQYSLIKREVPHVSLDMIFDVGANKGDTARETRGDLPNATIHAFEPVPSVFKQLEASTAGLNINCHNTAVGHQPGTVKMTAEANSTMNRIGSVAHDGLIDVPITTLDNFCQVNSITKIDYLKIDTEGYDLEVIRGAKNILKNTSFVQCEVSANPYNTFHVDFRVVYDHMIRSGFYLFHMFGQTQEWKNGGRPVLRRFDPVFINGTLAGDLSNID